MSDQLWNICIAKWRYKGIVWRVRVAWMLPDGIPWERHLGRLTWTLFGLREDVTP